MYNLYQHLKKLSSSAAVREKTIKDQYLKEKRLRIFEANLQKRKKRYFSK